MPEEHHRRQGWLLAPSIVLLLSLWLQPGLRQSGQPQPTARPTAPVAAAKAAPRRKTARPAPASRAPAPEAPLPQTTPPPPTAAATPASTPSAAPTGLHEELIPKAVTIIRCYYSQDVASPGAVLGFDINGSGFNGEFQDMIAVDPGAEDIKVKNLRLVTANQIHGEMEVGLNAKTGPVYPRILIQSLPVFRSPDPLGVVRPGEVLDIRPAGISDDGRALKFRIVTNIDEAMFRLLRAGPTKKGMTLSPLTPVYPFYVDGTMFVDENAPPEDDVCGIAVSLSAREIFRVESLAQLAPANLGRQALVQRLVAVDKFRRPGDVVLVDVMGTGFSPKDVAAVKGQVVGLDAKSQAVGFISASQIRISFDVPADAPQGPYGVVVRGPHRKILLQEDRVFTVTAPSWVAGVEVDPAASPGRASTLQIIGRDFTPEFVKGLEIRTDEPNIKVSGLRLAEPSTIEATISVGPTVVPGDYWLHLSWGGNPVQPQDGSLIRVVSPY